MISFDTEPQHYLEIQPDMPYYAENLLEEITVPGEWYLNRDTGILYFWPPDALDEHEIYVSHEKPLSLKHLTARMRQTGQWNSKDVISEKQLRSLLLEKIRNLDVSSALEDVEPFVRRKDALSVWSKDLFEHVAGRMIVF